MGTSFEPSDFDPTLGGLITEDQVPPDTTRVDRTTLPPSQDELSQLDPAEVDKRLRDFGLDDPPNQALTMTPQGGGEAVITDASGAEVFRGPQTEVQDVFNRLSAAQRRIRGEGGGGGNQRPAIGTPEQEGVQGVQPQTTAVESTRPIENTPPDNIFAQLLNELSPSTPESLGGSQQDSQTLAGLIQRGVQGQEPQQPQAGAEGEEPEPADPQEAAERAAPQGATASDVAALIDPARPQDAQVQDVAGLLQGASSPQAPSQERLQQAQAQAPEDFGRLSQFQEILGEIQGGAQQAGEVLGQPEVQRGLSQLAQLFVRPESGTGQVARSLEEQTTQQIQADQLQALIEGEDVDAASPQVVQQAEEVQQQERRTDQQDRRLDLEERRLELQRQQQLMDLAQSMQDREQGDELKGFEIDSINQQAIGEFLPRVLQNVDDSTGLEILSTLRNAENPSPELIRSQLNEEEQEEFDQFRQRLQEAVISGDQTALFGALEEQQQATTEEEGGGDGGGNALTITSGDPESLQQVRNNASAGDTITVTQDVDLPSGRTMPRGQYQVQDDMTLQPIQQ